MLEFWVQEALSMIHSFLTPGYLSLLAHTPGRYELYPGYPQNDLGDEDVGNPYVGGEYNLWTILNLLPNLGLVFTNVNTTWAPVFRFIFSLASSALAVDFDTPNTGSPAIEPYPDDPW